MSVDTSLVNDNLLMDLAVGKLCVPLNVGFAGVGGGAVVDTIFFSFFIDFECRRPANSMVAGA